MKYEIVPPVRSFEPSELTTTAKLDDPAPTTIVLEVGPDARVVVVVVDVDAAVAAVTFTKTLTVFVTLAAEPIRRTV